MMAGSSSDCSRRPGQRRRGVRGRGGGRAAKPPHPRERSMAWRDLGREAQSEVEEGGVAGLADGGVVSVVAVGGGRR